MVVEENVENWLNSLSKNMVKTLQKQLTDCMREPSLETDKYPSQILCLNEEIKFTEKAVGKKDTQFVVGAGPLTSLLPPPPPPGAIRAGKLSNYKSELSKLLE